MNSLEETIVLPEIELILDALQKNSSYLPHKEIVKNTLERVLMDSNQQSSDFLTGLESKLPLITHTMPKTVPANLSFFALSKYRANSFKFFNDMINYWLVPGKRLNLVMIYAVDFKFPEIGSQVYTLCEVMIRVEEKRELEAIIRNLPTLESELKLGIEYGNYARKILEYKGIAGDQKTAWIQEYIAKIIKRYPQHVDHDILTEMQHILVTAKDEFKAARGSRHLGRIVGTHYLFRRSLRSAVKGMPEKRHLKLKIFRGIVKGENGPRPVLSVLVGVNFFRDKEVVEKSHILKAIQNYIPSAQAVENSYFSNKRGSENLCTLYLEIEKGTKEPFTIEDVALLREELPGDLKDRIQHLMYPVFMPRNEEEVMRNILSLSSQIKYLRDIPQVFISFDEQTHAYLFFTIVLVRVLRDGMYPIQDYFKSSDSFLEYFHDRTHIAGTLRKKYKKEATVFRLRLNKEPYLRQDHTIDLNKARHAVSRELTRVIGEFRDFNGGMITKQNELFHQFRQAISENVNHHELLIENFFYSLTPVIMRSVLEPEDLKMLFLMHLDALEQNVPKSEKHLLRAFTNTECAFILIRSGDLSLREEIGKALVKLQIHSSQLANSYVSIGDFVYLGYIFRSSDPIKQQLFLNCVHAIVYRE